MFFELIPLKEILFILLIIFLNPLLRFFLIFFKANERFPYYAYFSSHTLQNIFISLRILILSQLLSSHYFDFLHHYQLLVHVEAVLVIITITFFTYNLIDYFIYCLEAKDDSIDSKQLFPFFKKILLILLLTLTILAILQYFGYSIGTILTGLGIGGIAVALAAQESLSNFIASFVLIIDKPFQLSDIIKVDNLQGEVIDFGLKSTTLKSIDNILYVIPNKILVSSSIENLTKLKKRTLKQVLRIEPSAKDNIESFLKEAESLLKEDPRVEPERILFQNFTNHTLDLYIQYTVRLSEKPYLVNSEFNLKFLQLLEKHQLKITSRS